MIVALSLLLLAAAQDHSMHDMPGMAMPAKPAAPPPKALPKPRPKPAATKRPRPAAPPPAPDRPTTDHATPDHSTMDHATPPDPHAGHDMSAMPGMDMPAPDSASTGTSLPAGNAPAPPVPADRYADRFFPPAEMARAHAAMMREDGAQTFAQIVFNLAEYQPRAGRDGWRWDGEAWFGGDIDRLTVKTEGEATAGSRVDAAEVQALYSRAIGPYFNLQAGVRHDLARVPRTYATLGVEGLAPYWFDVEAAVFLSDRGDLLARVEGYYDQRITQRLILQPRAELNLAAQDVPRQRIGAGLSTAELGLRVRYEITRRLAPYVGVSYEAKTGTTARYARADGDDPTSTAVVMGIRFWL